MGIWKKLGNLASSGPSDEELRSEIEKREQERPHRKLLTHFELKDLKDLCEKVYGTLPSQFYYDKKGQEHSREMNRYVFERHILDNIHFDQIKQFALRYKIVSPSLFPNDSDAVGDTDEFDKLINSIHRDFDPEKITNEEHLESQLTIYLKAKFPNMKVERQQYTKRNERLDVVVDEKYVFEIKVPKNRTQLRDMKSQLEEYKEQYPNLCAVIADISKVELDENSVPVESNLSQSIKEYADIYKTKLEVPTIIKEISTRK